MPGYQVRFQDISVGDMDFHIRSLLDHQQYHDPELEAENLGISPESWPLFGQVWPSGQVLAHTMLTMELEGKRILEVGAGLALASLVVHRRGGDVTASDYHPLIPGFLAENLRLNDLGPINYQAAKWSDINDDLGLFDMIIGSELDSSLGNDTLVGGPGFDTYVYEAVTGGHFGGNDLIVDDVGGFRLVIDDLPMPLDSNGDGRVDANDDLCSIVDAIYDGETAASLRVELMDAPSSSYGSVTFFDIASFSAEFVSTTF